MQTDIYQTVTDKIVAAIESADHSKWEFPWTRQGDGSLPPINVQSHKPYRGVNVLLLWCAAQGKHYASNEWATYNQWQAKGAQVRKGEKATAIVFWKKFEAKATETGDGEDGDDDKPRARMMARGYNVFNADQVDGYAAPAATMLPESERIANAEAFFGSLGMQIRHGGGRAFYAPSTDHVQLPPFAAFRNAIAYYATLGHEATHWTSHKSRCDRQLVARFGDEQYAAEELIAELGAAFLCATLQLTPEPRPDHAQYVKSWLRALKNDNRAIFTAASKAQQAVDYMQERQNVQEKAA